MALFKKETSERDLQIAIGKVRAKYQSYITEFKTGKSLSDEFELRYIDALKNRKTNILYFLYEEYQTAEAIYQAAKEKSEKAREKQQKLAELRKRDVAGAIFTEYENRIQKYTKSGFIENDEELDRILGAFNYVYNSLWLKAESLFYKKFKLLNKRKIENIANQLYEFIPRTKGANPNILFHYNITIETHAKENQLDEEKRKILKKSASILREIVKFLKSQEINQIDYTKQEIAIFSKIIQEIDQIIHDFRLITLIK